MLYSLYSTGRDIGLDFRRQGWAAAIKYFLQIASSVLFRLRLQPAELTLIHDTS
jgi:hypothetical protein